MVTKKLTSQKKKKWPIVLSSLQIAYPYNSVSAWVLLKTHIFCENMIPFCVWDLFSIYSYCEVLKH